MSRNTLFRELYYILFMRTIVLSLLAVVSVALADQPCDRNSQCDQDSCCVLGICKKRPGDKDTCQSWIGQGLCGPRNGDVRCPDDLCCSTFGFCGTSAFHCGAHCDKDYGRCNSANVVDIPKPEERCGALYGPCTPGLCCGSDNYCQKTELACNVDTGCQSLYGSCLPKDNLCGPQNSFQQCSVLGWCCGADFKCGNTAQYCSKRQGCTGECIEYSEDPSTTTSADVISTTRYVVTPSTAPKTTPFSSPKPITIVRSVGPKTTLAPLVTSTYVVVPSKAPDAPTVSNTPAPPPVVDTYPTVRPNIPSSQQSDLCGPNNNNAICAIGCCSIWGFCGTTAQHCFKPNCLYQCLDNLPPSPSEGVRCGPDFGGAACPAGNCCSQWGYCGMSSLHCSRPNCIYQCWN